MGNPTRTYGEADFALEVYKITVDDLHFMARDYLKEWYPAGLTGWYYRIWRPTVDRAYLERFGPVGPFMSYQEVLGVANKAFEDSKEWWRQRQPSPGEHTNAES